MAQYRMAQWERNYYGALADREEKRRQLVAQEQAANRAENEKKAAEVGMDYESYTRAMSTREGAERIRQIREKGKQAINRAAPVTSAEKMNRQRTGYDPKQGTKSRNTGTDLSGGRLQMAGAAPMVSRDRMAENYTEYQRKKAAGNMAAFSPMTQEQQQAADSYARWTKQYGQDTAGDAAGKQQDILRQMGRTTAPTAEELQAAAQAGNAQSKGALKKQERASTVSAMDYGNYALTAGAMTGLEKRKNGQALTADESAALAEYEDLAARNGQTVEEYLKGAAADYMRAYESSTDFDESREAYTRMQKGESLSPALDEIRQRQIDKYQGNTGVMEGAEGLLSQGKTGEWMAQWNREYQQAAADYKAQAEQLQLMRASGQATKDAIQTAQDALDATGRKLDELKAMSALGMQDYGEKSQANAEVYRTDANYWAVNNPDQSRALTVDEREDMPSELNAGWVSDQERGIYNYLYATKGQQAANDYLRSLSSRLAYRKAQAQEQEDVQTAQAHPVLASAASIAASPLEIVPSIATGVAALTGQEVSPYSDLFSATRTKNTLRGTVSGNIENPMLNLLYNAGMSMGDNLIAMGATGGAVGLASLQMSASAFGATAYDSLIRGGSTREAAMAGGASALTEYITEHMGFDRITQSWTVGKNALGYKGALMQFVKGFIPEGLEEVPGNFVEEAVDGWLMGGQSKRNLRIRELMRDQGMTLDQAMSQADAEFIGDTVMSFLAGGLAGGTMEAGSYVGGVHQGRSAAKADAKALSQELGVDQKTQQRALEVEYGVRKPDEKVMEKAREQIERSAETADHASFKAQAETDGQAVTVTGMAKSGEGAQVTVKGEDGTEKTVDLAQVTFASDDLRKAYAYASTYAETDTARQFLAGYEMSRDTVDNYRRGFEAAYSEGFTGRKATGGATTWAEGLNPTIRTLAQQAGRAAQNRQTGRLLFSEEVDTAVRRAVEAMPRAYTEGYTGVVNHVEGPLTAFESVQMAVADQLGKKFGMVYTFVNSGTDISGQEGVQGAYTAGTNHAVIALDAQEGALLSVAGHETLHYVKEWTGKNEASRAAYEDFQAFVLEKLRAAEGYDLEARIAQKQEQYRQAGQELDRAGAMEEIVADSMATVFSRDENVRDFLDSQDVSLVERVVGTVKRLVKEIKAAIQRIAKRNPEAAAMLKQEADTLQEIADRFDHLGAMATAVREDTAARERIESARQAETRHQAEPARQAETRHQAEAARQEETRHQAEAARQEETRPQAETVRQAKTRPQAETVRQAETRPQAETVRQAETKAQPETPVETKQQTENRVETRPQAETVRQAETKAQTETGVEARTQAETERRAVTGMEKSGERSQATVKDTEGKGSKAAGDMAAWAVDLKQDNREQLRKEDLERLARMRKQEMFLEKVDKSVRRVVEELPEEYTEGYTGVVNETVAALTANQALQMAVLDRIGKAYGMVYTVVDSGTDITYREDVQGVQGAYRTGTNHAVIALDAQEGLILSVAGHETLHFVKEWAGQNDAARAAYEDFQDFVLEKLQATEGYDLEARIAQKQELYEKAGQEIDRAGAIEEIVADSMGTVFSREKNVRDFMESQDVGLVRRVVNRIKRVAKDIKAAILRLAEGNPETAAMLKQEADTLQEIADRFDRVMGMANAVRESEGNTAAGNEGYKYQLKPYTEHQKENWKNSKLIHIYESDQQLRAFIDRSLSDPSFRGKMYLGQVDERLAEAIYKETGIETEGMNLTLHSDEIRKIMKDHGSEKGESLRGQRAITHDDFGKIMQIVQDADSIARSEDEYFGNPVIVFSKMIDGRMTAVTYASGKHMDLRVQTMYSTQKNKSLATATDDQASVNTPKATRGTALNTSISDSAEKNNPSGEKFSLRDDAYMEAAQFGDTQTAQRMLDEEAEEKFARSKVRDKKGRLLKVYHGTNAQFTVFDTSKQGGVNGTAEGYGIYLSDSQEVTKNYGERQIAAYVNITNPATRWKKTITQARLAKLIKETCMRQARRMVDDGEYDTVREAVRDSWVSNYTDTYRATMDAAYREAAASIIEMNDSDMDIVQEVMSGMSIRSYAAAEEFYNEVLTPVTGIDGFWTTWKNRETGERNNIILAFNSEQIKSAEPVTYDDAGEIIPLGERFDKGNPDIRYSLRDVDTQNDEMTRLMQENGELRETVRQLSERLRGTERRVEPAQVRQLARRFKEDTGTRVPLKTLTENMQKAFDAMANASTSGECQAAMEMMGSIAQDMLEKSTQANREMYEQYEEMRAYFRGGVGLSDTQWQEVKKQYGGNAAFRRAIAGLGLKVLPEGSPATLDRSWGEMCEQWPEFFKPDTNEGDQVEAVVAALNAVQVTYENPYGSSLPQYASDLAMLMYEEYLGMPEVKDGQTRQVEKLTRQLSDARAKIREQAAKARKVGRLEARIQEYKDAARAKERRQAQRRKDNQDYAKMRGQVIRQRDQLLKKLREPRLGAFIPQSMNDAVTELMRAIDFEGRLEGYKDGKQRNVLTAEAINRAKEAYKALGQPDADGARGPFAAYVNGDLVSDFDMLAETADGKAARDLTMREMEALRNIVAGYTAAVVNEDRLFMQERKESLSEAGEEMAAGMLTRREKMKQGNFAKWGANAVSKGLLKPVTVFGQFRGTPMEAAWKALRNAENVHIRNVSHAQEFLEAALKQYGQQESIRTEGSQAKRSRAKTYTTADGRKLQLTDQELMTLYATWKREQLVGTNHLLGGGFTLANAPRGTSTAPIRLAGPDLQEMIDRGLTQQQKEYVDHMVGFLSGECADWGNEVTMQLYGVEKFHEEYYIPFSVNKNYVAQEPATEQDSRLKTGSFTKALTDKASAPLEIRPFTEIWCQHVEKMSDYNAFVLPIEDMTRMMNYKTEGGERIRALVKRYYSPQTAEYIMNFLSRLNGNSATEAGGSWLNAFMSKAKGAAVTFNLSVAIQQAGSAARDMAEIDPKYFYGGTALAAANLGKRAAGKVAGRSISSSYAELEQYAPIAILKGWGYFDTNMSRGMYQRARNTRMDTLNEWGGKLAELGDRATWARIWEAVKLETADKRPDLTKGSEGYFAASAERFTEVIDKTQVVDSIFQRAEWATEKGMMKQQMAFMSEPLTMYNMVYRSVQDLSGANGKAAKAKAGKQLSRTLASITVSSAVTAALKSIVTALRDRDNEKKDEDGNIIGVRTGMDKWLDALGDNFTENMLGMGSIFTNMVQGAFSYTSSGDLTTQWLSDFAGALKEMEKGAEGDWLKAAYKMTRGSSSLLGIGLGNLWRDVESIYRSADEYFNRDSLAGAAWDRSLSFEKRVAAAEKNYVMKKQGDGRKVNSGIYYDLMMDAYYTSGFGEDFATVVDAAIRTGGGEGIANSFKTKLREAEERVQMAAQALMDGDMTEYSRMYEELCESAVGRRVVASMINSEYSALQEKEEKEPPTSGSIIAELQRDDVATDPREMAANQAYSAAVEAGSATQLKQAVSALKAAGVDEETLYGKVRTTYKKDYCWAIWSGDRTTAQKASEMMKGAGVGIDNATLKAWTSDLNGSYASDEMYRLMREGDGKQAHLIHKYLVQANSSADMDKKLKDWVRKYVKGGKDEANVRAALKQMGYSQATIDSWFK